MLNHLMTLVFFFAVVVLLANVFSKWRADQDRQEAAYWREEYALLEYENEFLQQLSQRLVPRLVSRLGADFQDYLIVKELSFRQPETEPIIQELPKREIGVHIYQPKIKQQAEISAEQDDETPDIGYSLEEIRRRGEAILEARRAQKRQQEALQQENKIAIEPPEPQFNSIVRTNRQAMMNFGHQANVIEGRFTEVVDDVLDAPISYQQARPADPIKKGGRPRKYATPAERQAAYRARKRAAVG